MPSRQTRRLLIVGNSGREHVGAHFAAAALEMGLETRILDVREAWSGPQWTRRFFWHFMGKRPTSLHRFSRKVLSECSSFKPDVMLCTGIAPVSAGCLRQIAGMDIVRVNFLTDDPWNPKNGAGFFWNALRQYDLVLTPRKANISDLMSYSSAEVIYLPFAYNPLMHYYECPSNTVCSRRFACDLAIIGGADSDRIPLALDALSAGLKLSLYGGYWDRTRKLRPFWRGFVYGQDLRLAASCATVNLCMGRRSNRDGHAMRSFELPAMGACMVVEDTEEHRDIFGDEGHAALYYSSNAEMVSKVGYLKGHPDKASRMAKEAREMIITGKNTYFDRLTQIIRCIEHQAN